MMLRLCLAGVLIVAGGCKKANDAYCCTTAEACSRNGGDGTIRRCPDGDAPFCDNDGQYGGTGNTCIAPPGPPCGEGDLCEDPDLSVCVEGLCAECAVADDCPAERPVCGALDHACGACTGAAECSGFSDRPFCEGGGCVGCRGPDDCQSAGAPICDDGQRICRGCLASAECDSDVCDLEGGACVSDDDVLYVEMGGDGVTCTRADPCGSIQDAVDAATGQRSWIHVAEGSYQETVTIAGKVARILMHPDASVRPGGFDAAVFVVSGGTARVLIEGGTVRMANGTGGGPGDGVYCINGADLTLRRVVIENNDDEGVDSSDCTISIDRCDIRGNDGGGIAIDAGRFTVTNSFIARNGQPGGNRGGATIDSTEPGVFAHNTVFDNSVQDGQVGGVTCLGDYTLTNNIIAGNDSLQIGGAGCQHRFSLIEPDAPDGDGNIDEPPVFVSEAEGDFHLDTDSPGIDAAESSDVAMDWDGEHRPAGDAPDMGADEVVR